MRKTVKARFANGALTPLEPVDLVEGTEYQIDLDRQPPMSDEQRLELLQSTAGAWRKDGEYWEEMLRVLYEARSAGSRIEQET